MKYPCNIVIVAKYVKETKDSDYSETFYILY